MKDQENALGVPVAEPTVGLSAVSLPSVGDAAPIPNAALHKERPILFSGAMVRAILEGRKIQTRRIVKGHSGFTPMHITPFVEGPLGGEKVPTGEFGLHFHNDRVINRHAQCPYGKPGDRLWVRESWCHYDLWRPGPNGYGRICYRASGDEPIASFSNVKPDRWRPSIHMPRWASRITLEVVNVRVERLQDISEKDAEAEGGTWTDTGLNEWGTPNNGWSHCGHKHAGGCLLTARHSFWSLWNSINGPGSWDANPWVWVVEFKRIAPTRARDAEGRSEATGSLAEGQERNPGSSPVAVFSAVAHTL